MMSAVLALAAGLLVGWLATKAHADRIRADLIEERRELDIALSAARQQLSQEAHWRDECELLNNELRSLHSINTSLEADLREVTTRLEATQQHAEDKIRQMINSGAVEQALAELNAIQGGANDAEWNFLVGSAYYYKGWVADALRYFQTACRLAPGNREYEAALRNLQNSAGGAMPGNPYGNNGMAGAQAVGCSCCDMCTAMMCMDMCCGCGRGGC